MILRYFVSNFKTFYIYEGFIDMFTILCYVRLCAAMFCHNLSFFLILGKVTFFKLKAKAQHNKQPQFLTVIVFNGPVIQQNVIILKINKNKFEIKS